MLSFIKNKVLLIICCLSICTMSISGFYLSKSGNDLNDLSNSVSKIKRTTENSTIVNTEKYTFVNLNETIYKGENINKLKEQKVSLQKKYDRLSTSNEKVTMIIKNYLTNRYNFYGSPKKVKDSILKSVKALITDKFNKELSKTLSQETSGNMGVSENFKHTIKIHDIYTSDVTQVDSSSNAKYAQEYKEAYMIETYVKAYINNSYTAYINILLIDYGNGWLIDNESIQATYFPEG